MDRRRVLLIAGGTLTLGVAGVVAAPLLFGDRLVAMVVDGLNAELDATVTVGRGEVSLLADFPRLRVRLHDLKVDNKAPFEGTTLVEAGEVDVSLDVLAALGGKVRVTGLALRDARVDARVTEDGLANWDITGPAADAPATAPATDAGGMDLSVEDLVLERVAVSYDDREGDTRVSVTSIDLRGSADMGGGRTRVTVDGAMAGTTVESGGVTWLKDARLGAKGGLALDDATGRVDLQDDTLSVNALTASIAGSATPVGEDWDLDLSLATKDAGFKSVLSLVPAIYAQDFAGLSAEGRFDLAGTVKGTLPAEGDELPGFDLQLAVQDGRFRYPDLPSDVGDVQVQAHLTHPGGDPDGIGVDVPRFHLVMAGAPVEGRLKLAHPMSDPDVDMALKGKVDLATLAQVVPPDPGTTMAGTLDLDLTLKGRVSAFEAQDVDAVQARGLIALQDVVYTDEELPEAIHVDRMTVAVDPRAFDMADLRVRFGQSDLHATGRVDNAIAYALTDAPLRGSLAMDSKKLDLRPYMADEDEAAPAGKGKGKGKGTGKGAAPAESSLVAVPDNLDLALTLDADQVLADDYDLRNVRGRVRVADSTIHLERVKADTLGGQATLSGTYKAPTDQRADVDLDVNLKLLDLRDTFRTVDTFARIAPVARDATGEVSMAFKARTALGPTLAPDLPTLMSQGSVETLGVQVAPFFLGAVSEALGQAGLNGLSLDDKALGFTIRKGQLDLSDTPVRIGDLKGRLRGGVGVVDETLDLRLKLQVPAKGLKQSVVGDAVGKNGTVPVTVTITGPWKKPKVRVDLGDLVDEVKDAAVDALLGEASAQGDKLLDEARRAADLLVDEAKKQAARLEDEADKQARKLVKNAKGNPVQEVAAKEAAKQLRKQAKKQGKKLVGEARKAGDKLIAKAEQQKQKLLDEAAARSGR